VPEQVQVRADQKQDLGMVCRVSSLIVKKRAAGDLAQTGVSLGRIPEVSLTRAASAFSR